MSDEPAAGAAATSAAALPAPPDSVIPGLPDHLARAEVAQFYRSGMQDSRAKLSERIQASDRYARLLRMSIDGPNGRPDADRNDSPIAAGAVVGALQAVRDILRAATGQLPPGAPPALRRVETETLEHADTAEQPFSRASARPTPADPDSGRTGARADAPAADAELALPLPVEAFARTPRR